ncbi:hypothetical protein IU433_12295 [Nocardia puris]|uniref:hypothetical protein n=1 Tax=Nocardia puris TaxID=208602 RepID=UPI0018939FA8|nr:hypothetical protein [Nocardia puris]MBF6459817.1 hypothetical protein [Nocardia puris]
MTKDPWPFPADTPLERARRIAASYRTALASVAPELCTQLDAKAVALGQTWVRPIETEVVDLDQMLTAEQVGELLCVAPRTVRMWGYRGHIERLGEDGKPLYRFRDVVDYLAARRQRGA